MTSHPTFVYRDREPSGEPPGPVPPEASFLLGAVRDDIRQTLRAGWIDPAIDAVTAQPVFLTAAWSAIRPNVGRSFHALARRVRTDAVAAVRKAGRVGDLRSRMRERLSDEEIRRVEESAKAAHLAAPKVEIVLHALGRAIHRDRIPGTGLEEPPIRRGVPDWQRWMSMQHPSEMSQTVLDEAVTALGHPSPPAALRLLSRWPTALSVVWNEVGPLLARPRWRAGALGLRRLVGGGVATLPHPIDLQWSALASRGFSDEDRRSLAAVIDAHDSAMATQTLIAAFTWLAVGAPEVGVEG